MRTKLAISIAIVRLLDVFTTHYHVSRFGYEVEGNPITRSIMQTSYPLYLVSNIAISLLLALAVYKYKDSFVVRNVGLGVLLLTIPIVISNAIIIL